MVKELKILSIADLEQVDDIEEEVLPVPEWGGALRIRSLTKAAQGRIRRRATMKNGDLDVDKSQMWMLLEGIVEPKLAQKDFALLAKRNAGVVDRVIMAISRLSGITPDSQISAEAVDEAEAMFQEE